MELGLVQAIRVIDVNANRAAEGLRSLEDFARLVREDGLSASLAKHLRHRLTEVVASIDREQRLAVRSTARDAGTDITTTGEMARPNLDSIVAPACERVTQSLRNLEEFSKCVSAATSHDFKRLRYEAYDTLARIESRLLSNRMCSNMQLYLLVDCSLPVERFISSLTELSDAGVDLFQLRDKRAEGAELVRYARAGVEALKTSQSLLIVNDRIDIALATGAAGVHLGQEDVSLADAKQIAGNRMWIGISTHNMQQAISAEQGGADYIGCGPTFPSETKVFEQFAGTEFLAQVASQLAIPAFGIGGINQSNVAQVMDTGCRRVAVSQVIHSAAQPTAAARQLKAILAARHE